MPIRWLGRPSRKPTPEEVRERLLVVSGELAHAGLEVGDDDGVPWVAWCDGPAVATVQAAAGELTGWEWIATMPDVEAGPARPEPAGRVWARRAYTERALVTGLVRFYGMRSRYFTTADERYFEEFVGVLDTDDPARSGYPIVDAVVDAALAAPDPDPVAATADRAAGAATIDVLSARLRRIGYERLWAQAYKAVP